MAKTNDLSSWRLGSLFGSPGSRATQGVKKVDRIDLAIDADPGYFYDVQGGHAIFKTKVKAQTLTIGPRIPLNCIFEAYQVLQGSDLDKVGYYFVSQFQVHNGGGYLVTWMANGAGKATSVETMLKTDELVVFNYPNKGALIISPKVNDEILNIFSEQ